ncbi:hypothetical protein PENTCL1PPCAC_26235, partial [Pristionchus entomophagus]
ICLLQLKANRTYVSSDMSHVSFNVWSLDSSVEFSIFPRETGRIHHKLRLVRHQVEQSMDETPSAYTVHDVIALVDYDELDVVDVEGSRLEEFVESEGSADADVGNGGWKEIGIRRHLPIVDLHLDISPSKGFSSWRAVIMAAAVLPDPVFAWQITSS